MNIKKLFFNYYIVVVLLSISSVAFAQKDRDKAYIPLEKNISDDYINSLFKKGDQKIYSKEELKHISMPCGGIGTGQVEVTGYGELIFSESIYNQQQQPNAGFGLSTGYQYIHPQELQQKLPNEFTVIIKPKGAEAIVKPLNDKGFDAIEFIGEYPIAQIAYRNTDTQIPVDIKSEVFSPFVPHDLRSSSNPVTILKYAITNNSKTKVEVTLAGWLKNADFPVEGAVNQTNTLKKSKGLSAVSLEMQTLKNIDSINKHPGLGGVSIGVMDSKAIYSVASESSEEFIKQLVKGNVSQAKKYTSDKAIGSGLSSTVSLTPNETKEITFLISWYFPNYYENGRRYEQLMNEAPGLVGHLYNNWYQHSFDVATYVTNNFDSLYNNTKLYRDTYFDTTLPYWLANRISMPLSTLAAGNIAIWQNGRMYGYEGIGFCQGTCGHVYNFVVPISKLFPELERSVRLQQDFNSSGSYSAYSKSGRINFRGYGVDDPNAKHAYASDAQSGYVLKAYREHLMSTDNTFLNKVWEQVKGAIGYQIYKDGAEIGLEPNGVLEGIQTFWDPMWYGPNPYNNSLYLAALRAVEEMAKIQGEFDLAKRYRSLFEKGQAFMEEQLWNGEFYMHLYPNGFRAKKAGNGFIAPENTEINAERFIKNFNSGGANYYEGGGCDAQQLFGQNWARQLGLGYILPKEHCAIAAANIFKYNWTPDISTIYDYFEPNARKLADKGEAAMVNGSWPHKKSLWFENRHDKYNIWSGLEYEASCDMINEGLVKEGLIIIRSIHDRYDGVKRNPWNEIEGSDHYSRAMQSWNVLLSLSGFTYNGPAMEIGFTPKFKPEDFKTFFSAAEGWGTFEQKRENKQQKNKITLRFGSLKLKKINLDMDSTQKFQKAQVLLNGKKIKSEFESEDTNAFIRFQSPLQIKKDDELLITLL
ncbi:GH116 family glycosyl hydrolase [Aquimarina sp. ERC-38]|uniref:GH116 family glycosyl hydrolase n=1 Tax=Aquimarina sp. ERC-38 TaxID=2949996 RepID=UPI002247023C|nr:GH116 family glycosyl hydrolase [Aquimarina sp. ERC-38]UZO80290.1 GH116 family glycosyl hydrolase [Aquimarina sp. ERC-38]